MAAADEPVGVLGQVPLKAWAEARAKPGEDFAWGTSSRLGVSWPNTVVAELNAGRMAEEQRLAFLRTVLHPDGPEYQRLDEGAGCEGPQHC